MSELSPNVVGIGRPKFQAKQSVAICTHCHGRGYTRKTAPVIKDNKTISLGSGCPKCLGTGRA